jgi:VCBS repeat-containing protein
MECPNCITIWKCNEPHLIRVNDSIYKSEYGHFIINDSNEWVWLANEKNYSVKQLSLVIDTLNNLNKLS